MGEHWTDWTLKQARPRIDKFIERLRDTANVRESCKQASIPRSTAYYWRNKWKSFEREWNDALEDACDLLEAEARRRAVDEESDRLLMFLLKAHRPEKYKDRVEQTVTGADGGPVEIEYVNDWRQAEE